MEADVPNVLLDKIGLEDNVHNRLVNQGHERVGTPSTDELGPVEEFCVSLIPDLTTDFAQQADGTNLGGGVVCYRVFCGLLANAMHGPGGLPDDDPDFCWEIEQWGFRNVDGRFVESAKGMTRILSDGEDPERWCGC